MGELLTAYAAPIVRSVVGRGLARDAAVDAAEVEDVCAEALANLLAQLRKREPDAPAIEDFAGYAATVAHNSFNFYLRRKRPNRTKLKNRLRYFLDAAPQFVVWQAATGEWLAARGECADAATATLNSETAREIEAQNETEGAIAAALLTGAGAPVRFEELIGAVAARLNITDKLADFDAEQRSVADADGERRLAAKVENAAYLRLVWDEIGALPPLQRAALLLNLRDFGGADALELFVVTGAASVSEIAAAVSLAPPALAEIWRALPLDDRAIAERLGLSRQQVINLRKSARERLARRLRLRAG